LKHSKNKQIACFPKKVQLNSSKKDLQSPFPKNCQSTQKSNKGKKTTKDALVLVFGGIPKMLPNESQRHLSFPQVIGCPPNLLWPWLAGVFLDQIQCGR
jgi:hypothetical protein